MSDVVENSSRERLTTDKIEVTERMLDAGSAAMEAFYMGEGLYDLRAPCLAVMYTAMHEVARKADSPSD